MTAWGQKLKAFSYSNCLLECLNDSSKISEITKTGEITIIKLKTYAPCNGNLAGNVTYLNENLNLMFWTKSTKIKRKDGTVAELIEVADCNCLFDFTFEIHDIKNTITPVSILINGQTLQEIDARHVLNEIGLD